MIRLFLMTALVSTLLTLSGCYSEGEKDLDSARAALKHRQPNQAIRLTTRAMRYGDLNKERLSSALQIRIRAFTERAAEDSRYADAAKNDLDAWVTLEPENAQAWFQRAYLSLSRNEHESALQDLNTGLLKADPDQLSTHSRLAQPYVRRALIFIDRKQYESAENDLQRARELDDKDPDLQYACSFIAERSGNKKEALHLMELADFLYAQRQGTAYLLEAPVVNNAYFRRLYKLREACGHDPMKRSERFAEAASPPSTKGTESADE